MTRRRHSHALSRRYGRAASETTPVVFRVWPKSNGGGVIALFPTLPGSTSDPYSCDSFEHVGQHGSADCTGTIRGTRAAKPDEYASLKRELESPPYEYKLKVYARVPRSMNDKRLRDARARA